MPWIKEHGPQPGQSVSSLDIYTSDAHAQRCSSCDIARTYNTTQSPIASYAAATYLHEGNNSKNNLHEQVLAPTSAATSISTILSNDDFDGDHLPFQVPEYDIQHMNPWVMAATPGEFADHFPSLRKMSVKHDDMTDDGNMNLRVDTTISASTRRYHDITLFHLRMYDLKNRDFSFRRYCRDSGKEICRSKRKSSKTPKMGRPMLQRSLSNALSSLRSTLSSPKCQNNSHTQSFDFEEEDESALPSVQTTEGRVTRPSDTITVEFANYAHLEVKQRRARSPKYGFKYWGTEYSWKRARIQSGSFDEISYHLVDLSSHASVAHIVPVPLSDAEAREEQVKGGWVPPCSMWISDEGVCNRPSDIADVVVATGLIVLVDDCINRRWHPKSCNQSLALPFEMDVDHDGSKHLINESLNRGKEQGIQSPILS